MRKVILDTNFLLIPGRFKVDIFSEIANVCDFEFELFVFDGTITELEKIVNEAKLRFKDAAKIGLELIKQKKVNVIKGSDDSVDNDIVAMAEKEQITVATQDKELKRRLKEKKAQIIDLKQKQYLVLKC